ncbi:hypothetical protein ACFU5P_29560, partial [Streptomyces sp. NPDC057433]|uniref:hypothetical protein n=1 Tax=Streptomyces sp. NPDC057433 TaxID=3346132 RepID=UPI00369EC221
MGRSPEPAGQRPPAFQARLAELSATQGTDRKAPHAARTPRCESVTDACGLLVSRGLRRRKRTACGPHGCGPQ